MDGRQQATASLDQPPPAPPSDPEKQKCIDQVAKYVAEEGGEVEGKCREAEFKFREFQFFNPAFTFLFGGEGEDYYMYKLRLAGGSPQPFKVAHRCPELSCDVASEMNDVLNGLTSTKESIESAKTWFMKRCTFAPSLAEAFRDKLFELDNDPERQWHILYLVSDILFDSLQRRVEPKEIDDVALAFEPLLLPMLKRIDDNPGNKNDKKSNTFGVA